MVKAKPIIIAGCGPGHPDYVCPIVKKTAEEVQVLVGAPHLLELFKHVRCERIVVRGRMDPILDKIDPLQDKQVCILTSGDTGLYSLSQLVIKRFGRTNCWVLPGISSVQLAFARLGLDWSDARLVSAHGRTPEISFDELRRHDKIAVLAGTEAAVAWCGELFTKLGEEYMAVSCEDLSLATEQMDVYANSHDLVARSYASRTIILLLRKELLI